MNSGSHFSITLRFEFILVLIFILYQFLIKVYFYRKKYVVNLSWHLLMKVFNFLRQKVKILAYYAGISNYWIHIVKHNLYFVESFLKNCLHKKLYFY